MPRACTHHADVIRGTRRCSCAGWSPRISRRFGETLARCDRTIEPMPDVRRSIAAARSSPSSRRSTCCGRPPLRRSRGARRDSRARV